VRLERQGARRKCGSASKKTAVVVTLAVRTWNLTVFEFQKYEIRNAPAVKDRISLKRFSHLYFNGNDCRQIFYIVPESCADNKHLHFELCTVSLGRFTLRNLAHTNFCNEAHALYLARYPKANSPIRNILNKIEHVLTKTQRTQRRSQSVKPGKERE
jgi:hypothetical protein